MHCRAVWHGVRRGIPATRHLLWRMSSVFDISVPGAERAVCSRALCGGFSPKVRARSRTSESC
eukprot:4277484-Lingulodinium_polyedra.AAC.1